MMKGLPLPTMSPNDDRRELNISLRNYLPTIPRRKRILGVRLITLLRIFAWLLLLLFTLWVLAWVYVLGQDRLRSINHKYSNPKDDGYLDGFDGVDPVGDYGYEEFAASGLPLGNRHYSEAKNNFRVPRLRYEPHYDAVGCWPSTGGVWYARLPPLALQHLGIDRFDDTWRDHNSTAEDAFCKRLQAWGADWYSLPPTFKPDPSGRCGDGYSSFGEPCEWSETLDRAVGPQIKSNVEVCFPSTGGAWTLKLDAYGRRQSIIDWNRQGFSNALTMDERCEMMDVLGGKFYKNVESMPHLDPVNVTSGPRDMGNT